MNLGVAGDARCILHRLVMDGRSGRTARAELCPLETGVALKAKLIHVVARQQSGVGRSMRRMAERASLGLHYRVLVDERSGIFLVTLDADGVTLHGRLCHTLLEGAVGIVAIGACH